jgi:uncharacterized protein (TIGR02145 family)
MKRIFVLCSGLVIAALISRAQRITDYDGNSYDTVIIGSQVWMKQNLRTTHYNNGIAIPLVIGNAAWASLTTGARSYYDNDSTANDAVYGALYNWYAVSDINLICPSGWHVSTNAEWQNAEIFLGGSTIAGGKMKEAGTVHWKSPNTGATNSSGFTGLPGGMRDPLNNSFRTLKENGLWWTATAYNTSLVWSTYLWYLFAGVDHNPVPKHYGLSIRCVKDVETGVGQSNQTENIRIYPNPGISIITFSLSGYRPYNVSILNTEGKCVMKAEIDGPSGSMDISSLPKGFYLVIITGDQICKQQKLIKE